MREMKDSGVEWIAKIPKTWTIDKTTRLFHQIGSGTTPKLIEESISNGTIHWIQSGDIKGDCLQNTKLKIMQDVVEKTSSLKVYKAPFIVIAMYGASIGNSAISIIDACVNQACCILAKPSSTINLDFAFYATVLTKDYLIWKSDGGGQPNISQEKIKNVWYPIPTDEEQNKIVTILKLQCSRTDALIANNEAQIEKLKQYKQSLITEVVTKGLDPTVPMKDSGVEWVDNTPSTWCPIRLKHCTYIRARLGWKGLKAEEYVDEGYPLLSAFNIQNNKLDFTEVNFINKFRYDESPEIKLQISDILLVKDGAGIGKCAIIEELPMESTTNGSLAVITITDYMYPKYLYYYFLSTYFQKYIDRIKDGMGVPHLFQSDLREICILIPSKIEQKLAIDYLDTKCAQIDRLIAIKQAKIEKLTQYKKSLIYEYVTGKKEVISTDVL